MSTVVSANTGSYTHKQLSFTNNILSNFLNISMWFAHLEPICRGYIHTIAWISYIKNLYFHINFIFKSSVSHLLILPAIKFQSDIHVHRFRVGVCFFSSALCYCTAELLSSRRRPSFVRPSVDIVFSETVKWIDTKFYWQVPIHHISRPFFCISKF